MTTKPQVAVGLDAGSARTRCVACLLEDNRTRVLGLGETESRGWNKGRIGDQGAIAEIIMAAVQEAERSAQVPIESVVAGVGGTGIQGYNSRGIYEFGRPRVIENDDMQYAVELASRVRFEDDRLLLQLLLQDFTLDGRAGFRNPRGAICSRLEANVHVITASAQDHHCLIAGIHQAHLSVDETVFEPLAAAYASILPEARARGVALVDIGAHSTDLVVYEGEALVLASSLPIGGDHFTRDLAYCLCVSYEDAMQLKEEHGCALRGLTSDSSMIEIPVQDNRAPREATRRQMNEVLEARAEELFRYVRNELARAGMEQSLMEGVVLAGGGALLNGMCDMAERVLNCQARTSIPIGIEQWPPQIDDAAWSTAAGLAMYSARLKSRRGNGGSRFSLGWW